MNARSLRTLLARHGGAALLLAALSAAEASWYAGAVLSHGAAPPPRIVETLLAPFVSFPPGPDRARIAWNMLLAALPVNALVYAFVRRRVLRQRATLAGPVNAPPDRAALRRRMEERRRGSSPGDRKEFPS